MEYSTTFKNPIPTAELYEINVNKEINPNNPDEWFHVKVSSYPGDATP